MSNNPWADGGSEGGWEDVRPRRDGQAPSADGRDPQNAPAALRPGGAFENLEAEEEHAWGEPRRQPSDGQRLEGAPAFLRPGGDRSETNPFLRKKVPQSQSQDTTPSGSFSKLTLDEPSTNPWQPAIVGQNAPTPPPPQLAPSLLDENTKDPWAPTPQPPISGSPALVSLPSGRESPAWDEDPLGNKAKPPTPPMKLTEELTGDTHVWDEIGDPSKGKAKAGAGSASPDDWNLIDAEPSTSFSKEFAEDKPPLPPRQPTEPSTWKPSREPVDGKTETYQIKNIRWHDTTSAQNPRTSPILIQNANGPCPLVALVNALTMTTPADIEDTALVQILRSREQVSLNLLLDAVFDELMSPRRTSSEDALPDVSDLYAFLQSLHTGMNVNPRFIPTESMVNAYKRTSLTHLHPTERGDLIPGTFENTAEMALYATFSIPLIHGWLPPKSEPAYESLERQAASYEDAQNLLFREEELEEKLSDPDVGLTESEQQLYQDVMIIKEFLETSATQLTHWGIEVIGKAIRPGTFAILFRNDHFSTLYCHPQSMQLLTLVTDAGFKTHEEIVWETLSDVNGESTEFVSGDFRVVSLSGAVPGTSAGNYNSSDGGEWTTVHNKRGKARHEDEPPMSPSTEQEDRDLALALQLQEEEEERHRAEEARRRRESILSEQYIEQQARQTGPANRGGRGGHGDQAGRGGGVPRGGGVTRQASGLVPGRTSSSNAPTTTMANAQPRPAQQVVRSLIPPQRQGVTRPAEAAGEEAPPSYEQAAQDQVYQPPVGHPSHADSSSNISRQSTRTGSVSMGQRQAGQSAGRRPPVNPAAVLGNNQSQPKDRDCVVM